MDNELINFEGQDIRVKTDNGETLINLANTARVCGLTRTDKEYIKVRWTDIKNKLNLIGKNCMDELPSKEITYVLDEIENTDDRNSIYMSSWLTKRFAMECKGTKAMEYKNFLATLDEKRIKGELIPKSNMEIANMVGSVMNNIIPTLTTEIAKQFIPVITETKQQVNKMAGLIHDQATIYDNEREELKDMIGLRSRNTMLLTDKLKEKLSDFYGYNIRAKDNYYQNAKKKIFKKFKVTKWEEISVCNFNKVDAYIDSIEDELERY